VACSCPWGGRGRNLQGSTRTGILGEALLNLGEFVGFAHIDQRSLPLKYCAAGTILHVSSPLMPAQAINGHDLPLRLLGSRRYRGLALHAVLWLLRSVQATVQCVTQDARDGDGEDLKSDSEEGWARTRCWVPLAQSLGDRIPAAASPVASKADSSSTPALPQVRQ